MAKKADRGTKRTCEACGGKFYDLGRDPIVCPMCNTTLVLEKPKAEEPEPEAEKVVEATAPEPVADPVVAATVADPEEPAVAEVVDDDLADIEVADTDIATSEGDETFLETDDGDDDVTGIIDAPLPKKEDEA